jgi:hypothetical protein
MLTEDPALKSAEIISILPSPLKSPKSTFHVQFAELELTFDTEITLEKLHLLFALLKNNSLIDSLENEFINAFTNKEVKYGIKWLDKARSGELNKQSIFYLIEKLINNKIILDVSNSDYNKKIEYVFRDRMGNILNNVRQSKSTFLNSNYQNEIIDNIISSL